MGSLTPIKDIPDEDLVHDLHIAYDDLCFVAARIIAIRLRIDPTETKANALAGVLFHLNQQNERVMSQADTM